MGRQKGSQKYLGRVEAALRLGYPLTVREIAKWAGCDKTTAQNLLHELSGQGKVGVFDVRNQPYQLWVEITGPAETKPEGLCLIARKFHAGRTGHEDIAVGSNFVECRECGAHAHVGSDRYNPMVQHGRIGPVTYNRPQDF